MSSPSRDDFAFPTVFYEYGEEQPLYTDSARLVVPANGTGVLLPDGTRYKVVDSWLSYDKDDKLGAGMHVFVEPVQP
ncbi:MAG: hypothetical protein QOE36_3330 [Gaiellaceae bacterium]|jgi:hypothetical protein|nr:hypothetical protein [Gaiellaceae bacterium]